ncbi:MAG: type IV conjugative transfer system protein TraL [Legionellaceae bacterium]|nr:type IV conjugative transfer system protein TraL [Legionellaceae bacterium]
MSRTNLYRLVSHLDEPRRYFTLSLDELCVAVFAVLFLVLSNQKVLVMVLGAGVLALLRHLKKGRGPRFLVVLAYWHLPRSVMQVITPKLPASHRRIWKA